LGLPGSGAVEVEVEFYAGYKGEERPVRLHLGARLVDIDEVLARWYGPDEICFQVRAGGAVWILRRPLDSETWTLAPWRGRGQPQR
jgi:hypothetical protein